jgi:hypothetical protein
MESDVIEPIDDTDKIPPAHEIVVSALEQLYHGAKEQLQHPATAVTIQNMEVDLKTISGMEAATSATFAPPSATIQLPRSLKRKRSMRQKERRQNRLRQHRKKQTRYKKWCMAK